MAERFVARIVIKADNAQAASFTLSEGYGLRVLSIEPMDHERNGKYSVQLVGDFLFEAESPKINTIKKVRNIAYLGLRQAKEAVDSRRINNLTREEALALKREIEPFISSEVLPNPG